MNKGLGRGGTLPFPPCSLYIPTSEEAEDYKRTLIRASIRDNRADTSYENNICRSELAAAAGLRKRPFEAVVDRPRISYPPRPTALRAVPAASAGAGLGSGE